MAPELSDFAVLFVGLIVGYVGLGGLVWVACDEFADRAPARGFACLVAAAAWFSACGAVMTWLLS